jgi:hypothetical protein
MFVNMHFYVYEYVYTQGQYTPAKKESFIYDMYLYMNIYKTCGRLKIHVRIENTFS